MDLRGETSADVWGGHPQTELDECAAGDEAEAEPEGVQAADPVSPVAPSESAEALSYYRQLVVSRFMVV